MGHFSQKCAEEKIYSSQQIYVHQEKKSGEWINTSSPAAFCTVNRCKLRNLPKPQRFPRAISGNLDYDKI